MFRNILVGVDGRQGGRDAAALTQMLAAPEAKVTLAHVYASDWRPGKGATLALAAERRDSALLLAGEREQCELDADIVSCGEVAPARGLRSLATRVEADLLVVGSSHHGRLGHVLLGDDARACLAGLPCALAVAPRGLRTGARRIRDIGVGYNGTPESQAALAAALDLAAHTGATTKALWVVSRDEVGHSALAGDYWPDAVRRLVDDRQMELDDLPGVEGEALYGGPREELARLGEEVDLLAIGSRGYGAIGRLVHGSVSSYLVRHASCAVLALPRPPARGEPPHAPLTPRRRREPIASGA